MPHILCHGRSCDQSDSQILNKIIFILVGLFLLSACTTISPIATEDSPSASWQRRQQTLASLTGWKLNGRLSIQTKDEGEQLNMIWDRQGDHHEITLSGPLNMGTSRLSIDPGKVTLVTSEKTYHADNAEQLLADVMGWRLPVNGLDYWIRGLPAPHITSEQTLDHRNRLQQLIQSEWEILYQSYTRVGDRELPRILFIKRVPSFTDSPAEQIELRVAISSWTQLGP